jgi:PadR family transcriptional regulator PadR
MRARRAQLLNYRVDTSLTNCKTTPHVSTNRWPVMPKLSGKELLILDLLLRERSMYGLEFVTASRGELKRGTVYVTLGRMEEKGYITSRQEDAPEGAGGLPRRVYRPTAAGRQIFEAWALVRQRLTPRFAR